eukprot:COSAG06_NODE_38433_length_423_cov_2.117284_1_plen_65_part_10
MPSAAKDKPSSDGGGPELQLVATAQPRKSADPAAAASPSPVPGDDGDNRIPKSVLEKMMLVRTDP